jgi:hypothetical protein
MEINELSKGSKGRCFVFFLLFLFLFCLLLVYIYQKNFQLDF